MFPDHDMELTFDVEVDLDDIRSINTLRLLIYNALDGDVRTESLHKSHSEMRRSQVGRGGFLFILFFFLGSGPEGGDAL